MEDLGELCGMSSFRSHGEGFILPVVEKSLEGRPSHRSVGFEDHPVVFLDLPNL
jgi:hypothetical protein